LLFAIKGKGKKKKKNKPKKNPPTLLPSVSYKKTNQDMMLVILRTKTFSASFMNEQALSLLHTEKIIRGHF